MPKITLTHPDGSTDTIPSTVGWKWERAIGEMFKLTLTVTRSDAQSVTLNRKEDDVELNGVTTGRLVDVNAGGATWELIVYSYEWDGNTVKPTGGGVKTTDTDDALVKQFVGDVSTWSEGTINQVEGSLTLISNHAQPHERLRKLEQKTPGELRFNADQSVNYVDQLGSDKSASITLSPTAGNLNGDIQITKRGRKIDATHVRVIGAHEGEAQLTANLVPASDGRTYEDRVSYSTSLWSDSSDDDWARWSNREAATQSEVDAIANQLAEDLTERHVEAKAVVEGEDLAVGDTVHVEKPESDVDRDMRIISITTRTTEESTAGTEDRVQLSTRTTARDTEQERVRNTQRSDVAFEGNSVVIQGGTGPQPVSSSLNATERFRYPPTAFEHVAELEVAGLPYRAYAEGSQVQNGTTLAIDATDSPSSTITLSTNEEQTVASVTVPSDFSEYVLWVSALVSIEDTNGNDLTNTDVGVGVFSTGSAPMQDEVVQTEVNLGEWQGLWSDPNAEAGDTVSLDVTNPNSSDMVVQTASRITIYEPDHDHALQPGVVEDFPNFSGSNSNNKVLPSGCDVIVNGNTVASDIGSGEFETLVDISGDMTKDAWNTIEITSDSVGFVRATPYIEAYKDDIGTQ